MSKTIAKEESIIERMIDIPDFPGYKITDSGHVISFLGQGIQAIGYEIKPRKNKGGYYRVYMRSESTGKRLDQYIHQLVAKAYIPNPNNLPEVNHIVPDKSKNEYTNLEWVTHKENLEHAYKYGYATRDKFGRFAHK